MLLHLRICAANAIEQLTFHSLFFGDEELAEFDHSGTLCRHSRGQAFFASTERQEQSRTLTRCSDKRLLWGNRELWPDRFARILRPGLRHAFAVYSPGNPTYVSSNLLSVQVTRQELHSEGLAKFHGRAETGQPVSAQTASTERLHQAVRQFHQRRTEGQWEYLFLDGRERAHGLAGKCKPVHSWWPMGKAGWHASSIGLQGRRGNVSRPGKDSSGIITGVD